jgi:short-subunit dehydrogenase
MWSPDSETNRKVAFITGASSGFGEGLALRFAMRGYAVGVSARRVERLRALVERIEGAGGRAVAYPADVSRRDALLEMIQRCREELGPIDLLIANAGVSTHALPEDLDSREVERVMAINFQGVVTATEGVLQEMLQRRSGQIVVVSSLASFQGLPLHGSYCASKAAMNAFFESLRLDVADRGVAVTIITPGFVKTEMTAHDRYPMPFLMDLDPALDLMVKGILKRKRMVRFPVPLSTVTWWARFLPRGLFDALVDKIYSRRSPEGGS